MTIVLVPVGRGNWKTLILDISGPAAATDLFPAIREGRVKPGDVWTLANGRQWRIVEVRQ